MIAYFTASRARSRYRYGRTLGYRYNGYLDGVAGAQGGLGVVHLCDSS